MTSKTLILTTRHHSSWKSYYNFDETGRQFEYSDTTLLCPHFQIVRPKLLFEVDMSHQRLDIAISSQSLLSDLSSILHLDLGCVGQWFDGRVLLGRYSTLKDRLSQLRAENHDPEVTGNLLEEWSLLVESFIGQLSSCCGFGSYVLSQYLGDHAFRATCDRRKLQDSISVLDEAFVQGPGVSSKGFDAYSIFKISENFRGCVWRSHPWRRHPWRRFTRFNLPTPTPATGPIAALRQLREDVATRGTYKFVRDIVTRDNEIVHFNFARDRQGVMEDVIHFIERDVLRTFWQREQNRSMLEAELRVSPEPAEDRLQNFRLAFIDQYQNLRRAVQDPSSVLHHLSGQIPNHRRAWDVGMEAMRQVSSLELPEVTGALCLLCVARAVSDTGEDNENHYRAAFNQDLELWRQIFPQVEEAARMMWGITFESVPQPQLRTTDEQYSILVQLRDSVAMLVGKANGMFGVGGWDTQFDKTTRGGGDPCGPIEIDTAPPNIDLPPSPSRVPERDKEPPDRLVCPNVASLYDKTRGTPAFIVVTLATSVLFALVVYFMIGTPLILSPSSQEYTEIETNCPLFCQVSFIPCRPWCWGFQTLGILLPTCHQPPGLAVQSLLHLRFLSHHQRQGNSDWRTSWISINFGRTLQQGSLKLGYRWSIAISEWLRTNTDRYDTRLVAFAWRDILLFNVVHLLQ